MDDISWETYHIFGVTFCHPQHPWFHQWGRILMGHFSSGVSQCLQDCLSLLPLCDLPHRSTAGLDHDILRMTKTGVIKWAQWEVLPGARPSILWSPTLWRQTLGKGSLPPAPGIPLEMCRRINKMCVGEHKHICALLKIRCQKFHKLASVFFFFSLHRIVCQCFSLKIILVTTYLLDT